MTKRKKHIHPPPGPSPDPPFTGEAHQSQESQEEFDSLFDSMGEGAGHVPSPPPPAPPPPLSDNDLAIFDPCCKQGEVTKYIYSNICHRRRYL